MIREIVLTPHLWGDDQGKLVLETTGHPFHQRIWSLQKYGSHIRYLNEFEQRFVESALEATAKCQS